MTLSVNNSGGAATAPVTGSPYTITPSVATGGTFAAGNYAITYATGNLTVNAAALVVTANPQSKTYGQTLAFGAGSTLFGNSGLQNGETIGTVTLSVNNNGGEGLTAPGINFASHKSHPSAAAVPFFAARQVRDYIRNRQSDRQRGAADYHGDSAEQVVRSNGGLWQWQQPIYQQRPSKQRDDWQRDAFSQRQRWGRDGPGIWFALHHYSKRGRWWNIHSGQLRDHVRDRHADGDRCGRGNNLGQPCGHHLRGGAHLWSVGRRGECSWRFRLYSDKRQRLEFRRQYAFSPVHSDRHGGLQQCQCLGESHRLENSR